MRKFAIDNLAQIAVKNFGAVQHPQEVALVLRSLRDKTLSTVLEIGTMRGGTLQLWSLISKPDGLLVCVDDKETSQSVSAVPAGEYEESLRAKLFYEKQKLEVVIGKTWLKETVDGVANALHGRTVDFLFVDGGHRVWEVASDAVNYVPFVSPNGTVVFHDVGAWYTSFLGAPVFWNHISDVFPAACTVALGEPMADRKPMGTGVVDMTRVQKDALLDEIRDFHSKLFAVIPSPALLCERMTASNQGAVK